MSHPKILLIDIETTPNLVMSWSLSVPGGYLSPDNVVQERTILCASYKWLNERDMESACVSAKDVLNDLPVLKKLRAALVEADAVIAHNGDHFDLPWIMARSIFHGLEPLPALVQIDTRKIARQKFYFNSNKLEYLATFLGVGEKVHVNFSLWKECMAGDSDALTKLVHYNRRDVLLLERVYNKLAPYVPAQANARLFTKKSVCPSCQSSKVQSRGFAYTTARAYRRYQCQSCGHWFRDTRSVSAVGD